MLTLTLNKSGKDWTMPRAGTPAMSQDSMAQGGAGLARGAVQPDRAVHSSRTLLPGAGNELQDAGRGWS